MIKNKYNQKYVLFNNFRKYLPSFFLLFFVILPINSLLYGDIIVTKDGMVLNGKIIEKKKGAIIFANYHGTFTIKQNVVKKVTETKSYKADVAIFKKMGKKVIELDVKKNYESGLKKKKTSKYLKKDQKSVKKIQYESYLYASPFVFFNFGEINKVLLFDYGAILSLDFIFTGVLLGKIGKVYPGLKIEIDYLHASHASDRIDGISFDTGPSFNINLNIGKYNCFFNIIPIIGFGYYYIEDEDFKNWRFKIKAGLVLGMTLPYKRLIVNPAVRFIYVVDDRVPLISLGISLGIGYSFF